MRDSPPTGFESSVLVRFIPQILCGLLLLGCVGDALGQCPSYSGRGSDESSFATATGSAATSATSLFASPPVDYAIRRLPPVDPESRLSSEFLAAVSVSGLHRLPPVDSPGIAGFLVSSSPIIGSPVPWLADEEHVSTPLLAASQWLDASSDPAEASAKEDDKENQEGESRDKKEDKEEDKQEETGDDKEIGEDGLPSLFESVVIERAPWYHLDLSALHPWKGSFEMGLDGSSGNSNTFNIRLGASGKRKTNRNAISLDLNYHKNYNQSVETANRLNFAGRCEWLDEKTPWTWFVQQTTDYDQFQPWNVRVVGTTGLGYRLIDTEQTTLTTRFGGGASQEVGGLDEECVPELNFGAEYEHQMTKRQKIKGSAEYFPNVTSFSECRVVAKTSWEVLLNEEQNLSLKIVATDRFNNPNPGGKLNDLDYSAVLLWSF
ncbi:MAG TPA: hypothetical protein DD670_16570 [Planctomycetaceae bacterium]|nr:hypothetical protein [Planctomycetaceae bacterium]